MPARFAARQWPPAEDYLRIDADRLAASNAELVTKIVRECDRHGRRPATTAEARAILGLAAA